MSIAEIINSKSKKADVCTCRMAIAYNLRTKTDMTLNQVGSIIKRDHATVHYLVEKCKDLISVRDRRTIEAVESYQQLDELLHQIQEENISLQGN